jgi:hypothetical protein
MKATSPNYPAQDMQAQAPLPKRLNHPANSSFEAEELARDRDEDHVTI